MLTYSVPHVENKQKWRIGDELWGRSQIALVLGDSTSLKSEYAVKRHARKFRPQLGSPTLISDPATYSIIVHNVIYIDHVGSYSLSIQH
jgi:hypothetical protein